MSKIDISIIFPLLNEEDSIIIAKERICNILDQTKYSYEIIFVDDGSTDNSAKIIKELCENNNKLRLLSFSRNFGQEYAVFAGLQHSKGRCAIYLDIDLQERPEIIPAMLENWENGYDIVCIRRKKRKDSFIKKFTAWLYYKYMSHLGMKEINNLANFTLLDRKVLDVFCSFKENNIQLRVQVNWLGFKKKILEVDREKREVGKTKFNFKKLLKIANRSIVSSTTRPLYLPFYFSILSFILFVASLVTFIVLIFTYNSLAYVFLILLVLFGLSGVILFSLGVLGMYLAYNYKETRNRPLYIVKEKVNFDD